MLGKGAAIYLERIYRQREVDAVRHGRRLCCADVSVKHVQLSICLGEEGLDVAARVSQDSGSARGQG